VTVARDAAGAAVEVHAAYVTFPSRHGEVIALRDVSVAIPEGRTLGVIGESGSGKTTLGRVALGLERPKSGTVRVFGRGLYSGADDLAWRSSVSVVMQEPEQALNPRMTVAAAVAEPLLVHERGGSRTERRAKVAAALEHVQLSADLLDRYPRELSGGQQQRVSIARAIVTRPRFIVLDEPTASLDLSVRGRILDILAELQAELGIAYLLISHDMATIQRLADQTVVLYRGCVIEAGATPLVASAPVHPYTRALISAVLPVDPGVSSGVYRLRPLVGSIGSDPATGCVLRGRCPEEIELCSGSPISLVPVHGRMVACARAREPDMVPDAAGGGVGRAAGEASGTGGATTVA
jgi:oligopeptide/dipeptide ABC transporter ATP-binding protein